MSSTTAAESSQLGVSNQLASLVPTFDPSRDDLVTYQQKVELVTAAWPKSKLTELTTRLILNTTGSAFQKLQIHQAELLTGEESAIKKLVELLGGQWGRVPLAKKYEEAEIALFHTQQHGDETNDSYLARADVNWSKLLAQKTTLADLQAFITLRGSGLTAEDKKKIILESETEGQLTVKCVAESIRMLGSVFFNDITGNKRTVKSKVYDQATLVAEASPDMDEPDPTFHAEDQMHEDEVLEIFLQEGDSDALLVHDFESALSETVQDDPELASAYSAYQIARHKLNEKARNRGFFPSRPFQPSQSKGKGFGSRSSFKGKGFSNFSRPKRSLQDRILSSNCRACGQKGHWKAECPLRQSSQNAGSSTSQAPTGTVVIDAEHEIADSLPLEFLRLPNADGSNIDEEATLSEPTEVFVCQTTSGREKLYYRGRILGESRGHSIDCTGETCRKMSLRDRLRLSLLRNDDAAPSNVSCPRVQHVPSPHKAGRLASCFQIRGHSEMHPRVEKKGPMITKGVTEDRANPICFATHTSFGVLDLGASKTVIGSSHVKSLICSLDQSLQNRLTRCKCNITFRFGNQGTLTSDQALVVPIGDLMLKIAIVPGNTPFLISNTLMRALQAQIDCQAFLLRSPKLSQPVQMELTNKGLFLIDLNELARASDCPVTVPPTAKTVVETFTTTAPNDENPAESEDSCEGHHGKPVVNPKQLSTESPMPRDSVRTCPSEAVVQKSTQHVPVNTSLAQDALPNDLSESETDLPVSHVTEPASEGHSDQGRTVPGRPGSSEPSGLGERDGGLWQEELRTQLSRGVEHRPGVGVVHGRSLWKESQHVPPQVSQVRGTHGPAARGTTAAGGCAAKPRICRSFWPCRSSPKCQADGAAQDPSQGSCGTQYWLGGSNPFSLAGRRSARGDRDVQLLDYGATTSEPRSGIQCDEGTHDESGKCPDQSGQSPGDSGHGESPPDSWVNVEPSSIRNDDITETFTMTHHDTSNLRRWIGIIEHELNCTLETTRPMGKPFMLGEVFCDADSTLTHQVRQLGQQAFRFGLGDGNLSQVEGRQKLFQWIAQHQPQHIWYSPTCGPWSSWSNLNASRSMASQVKYQQLRSNLMYQVAMGIVLYRHQITHGRHFHFEQPSKSLMLHVHGLSEIHQHSQACQFDMCTLGLCDPLSGMPMRKPMTVLTTHPGLYAQLHGRKCFNHQYHQPIEGQVKFDNQTMLRTEFSEAYPRKFSRLIAKVMLQSPFQRPFNWVVGAWCQVAETLPAFGQRDIRSVFRKPIQQAEKFPRSALTKPMPMHDKDEKRRRLSGKQSTLPYLEDYQNCLQKIHQVTPRVGKHHVKEPHIMTDLQRLFPDKQVVAAVACRGTDRTLAPPAGTVPQLAPFRKALMIIRSTGEVRFETNWEKWSELSNRQLIRPAHSCRLNVTIFAKDPEPVTTGGSQSSQGMLHEPTAAREPIDSQPQSQSTTKDDDAHPTEQPLSPVTPPKSSEILSDSKQSPSVLLLPKWERQRLMQIHKNLGHPSNERLAKALRNAGHRPEMVQAAFDLVCPSCLTNMPPKHQRPGSLKPMIDFNHKIYIDGISWHNSAKENFFLYHVLDAGSNFHVAFCAPSHTAKDMIQLLSQHWISWAGYPAEITHDSGTEFVSENFSQFCQQYGIKATVTNPEAHWQSGKIERHGRFLQEMLQRIDTELPISSYTDLQAALNQCTQAKNSMIIRHGYSPEVIVFGKSSRLPGSIMSDESIPSHMTAVQEPEELHPKGFKHLLQLREVARKAFHTADNSDSIRRAMLKRSCPERGPFNPNSWVMIWRTTPSKTQEWIGPQRVIIQDSNHTVWTTQSGKLYRSAPENVRHAHPNEGDREDGLLPEDITSIQQQITRMNQELPSIPETEEINNPIEPEIPHDPIIHQERSDSDYSVPSPVGQPDHEPEIESRQVSEAVEGATSSNDPESPDFQLLCIEEADALNTSECQDLAWKCEFDVKIPETTQVENLTPEESCILLATSAKKQRTEVRLHELTQQEKEQFEQAKAAEVANWIQTKTLTKVLRHQIPESQILKCRWILTWKPVDPVGSNAGKSAEPNYKAKARLVVLGYLDPKIEEIPRDSPTLNKTSRMLILQSISSHGWTLKSFDIKAAFLQGQPQSDRIMAVEPVPEIRKAMQMAPDEVGQLNKGAYGLIDAPYLWYKALVGELTKLGLETSPFDPCVFILRGPKNTPQEGKLLGIVGIHVDDGIYGGTPEFQQVMDKLEQKYAFGSKRSSAFTFTGIELTQKHDHSIVLSQSAYVRKIQSISIEAHRKTQPELPVNETERGHLRGLIGSLQYAATNTRPDLSSRLSLLQSEINSANIETLQSANRLLHEAKRYHDVTVTIKPIPTKNFRFMAFSDASFASTKKPDSHAGSIIVGTHEDINNNMQCPISPLAWGSKKIQKVVTSTLSAETTSLATALDQMAWIRLHWQWLHDPKVQWRNPDSALLQLDPAISVSTVHENQDVAVTDCKSLFDLITRTAPPSCSEFRVQLMARSIKESLKEGIQLRWVHTGAQLADALTKAMQAHFLRETLQLGQYRLIDENTTLKARAQSRDRVRWLREHAEPMLDQNIKKDECEYPAVGCLSPPGSTN